MVFVGSTPSKTSNASALEDFKKLSAYGIRDVEGTIDDTKALVKGTDAKSTQVWKIGTKSLPDKNYLKIGNRVLKGDSGESMASIINFNDLLNNPVEASGNGIYTLGRLLALKYNPDNKINNVPNINCILAMNAKTANSFIANADTAFQQPLGDFRSGIMSTFVISNAVIPNQRNEDHNVSVAKNLAQKGEDSSKWVNIEAMPQLPSKADSEPLKEINKIDASGFVSKIKEKKISRPSGELTNYVNEYVDTFFEPFITAYAERFKTFLKNKATASGVDVNLFNNMFEYIDSWKASELAKKEQYRSASQNEINSLFSGAVNRGSVSMPPASGAGKVVPGKEGEIVGGK
jgi:hypothetical protein